VARWYKKVLIPDHDRSNQDGYVYEHILIAEKVLGRKLRKEEVVHHIDGNKNNNNPSNLIVFATQSDHAAFHNGCKIYKENDVWKAIRKKYKCATCGKVFFSKLRDAKNHYCSKECLSLSKMIFHTNDKETLEQLLRMENGNFSSLARKFNVTSNAIVKRCKTLGLPYHSKDYKTG